jgi:enterochelin esterase-like enzyme
VVKPIMPKSILKRLKREQTPLIDGDVATFVWHGEYAPKLVGDFTGWEVGDPIVMKKYEPGVWTYQLTLPSDAYIEYSFLSDEEPLTDPNNSRVSPNGMGGANNYFSMPDYRPTILAEKHRNISHGKVTSYQISTDYIITGRNRTINLYQPPVTEQVPLMVVWDGQDYLHRANLNNIVDNLIVQGRIPPIALAMVNNGGQKSRHVEYSCNDATLGFLMTEVLPLSANHLNLIDINAHPGAYGVAGASMGGLMALYTGTRIPQVFGNVLSQSGAFSWTGIDMVVFDLLEHGDRRPMKIWMDVGVYDIPGLLDSNRRMYQLLSQKGYQATYREYNAGHNYPAWRDDIWRGLETLFGIEK